MEGIPYNYKNISHDLAIDNLANMDKILKWMPNYIRKRKRTTIDACRGKNDAVLRMTAGRSRWQ